MFVKVTRFNIEEMVIDLFITGLIRAQRGRPT